MLYKCRMKVQFTSYVQEMAMKDWQMVQMLLV